MIRKTLFTSICLFAGVFVPRLHASDQVYRPNEVSYDMSVELDPATSRISGSEKARIVNRARERIDRLYFHVYPNAFRWEKDGTYMIECRAYQNPDTLFLQGGEGSWLEVRNIRQGGARAEFSVDRELLTVLLPAPIEPGGSTELDLEFTTQMAPIAERSAVWRGNYSVGQWFPKLMVYDENGWALEHNSGYHFSGEFYGDFGSYDVEITVPEAMKVGATGHLVSAKSLERRRKALRFHADRVHDFAWVADEKFHEKLIPVGKTMLHILTRHPESRAVIAETARKAFEYYTQRVGPYPYEDFTVGETYYTGPQQYPQIVFARSWPAWLSRWVERDALSLLEMGVAHETAHQWFYGVVGTNAVTNAWLDEGFATFLEETYMRDTYGGDDNALHAPLLKISDRQLGDVIWRLYWPNVSQPIQTPSYKFEDPMHYYSSVYYGVALFMRHFEALMGREKFDAILREHYRRNMFRNVRPRDWYQLVREMAGAEAEGWWRRWINENPRSDYAVSDLESAKGPDGRFHHKFKVSQKDDFYAPVDWEVTDKNGVKRRGRAQISAAAPSIDEEVVTDAPIADVEVDPDHVAPDVDRFNNRPGFLPRFEFVPFTSKTVREDSISLIPLPYVSKRPGIGIETGGILAGTHYLDWYGYAMIAYDWRHKSITNNTLVQTLQADLPLGWELSSQRDVLISQHHFYARKILGSSVDHDPRHWLRAGPEYFGNLGDNITAAGGGLDYEFSNLYNGRELRYSLGAHSSFLLTQGASGGVTRVSARGRLLIPLGYKSSIETRGIVGRAIGTAGRSALFDLLADEEGAMRFDYDIGLYKSKDIRAASVELQFPVPYGSLADALAVIHGPEWEVHLLSDFGNAPDSARTLMDFGVGSRVTLATGGFVALAFNLEVIPYQTAVLPYGWGFPTIFFTVTDRLL